MIDATIHLLPEQLEFHVVDHDGSTSEISIPCGITQLQRRHFTHDPPHPEELTNAIGYVLDHLEDVVRELPQLAIADSIRLTGRTACVIAAVEHGGKISAPDYVLSREAAEDVFRTMATESAPDRAHNPGLPSADVGTIVAGCCAVVAIFRGLQRTEVTIDIGEDRSIG
jgi:exopolyphosphatase / guanosine-5'-triphosphate,3'-diphosphate pyrophosphatase